MATLKKINSGPSKDAIMRYVEKKGPGLEASLREAEIVLNREKKDYFSQKQLTAKKDLEWIQKVIKTGTFADRLSAFTVLIQESPKNNFQYLQKIFDFINPNQVRESMMAIDNLKELLIGDLLPKRKLCPFKDSLINLPNKDGPKRNQLLAEYYFEDQLLSLYQQFTQTLQKLSLDGPDALKSKAVNTLYDLLRVRADYEPYLIEKFVNKLGDPEIKRASHVAYLLSRLVNHENSKLKGTILKEVERVLFRPNIQEKARYYSLKFMTDIALAKSEKELANRLIGTYFNLFDAMTKKGEVKNKMMNVLITGVSRAFPYSNLDSEILEKRLESFYKLIHMVDKNTAVQGMALIYNVLDVKDGGLIADRFYSVIYRSLFEINIETCSRRALYLSLVFKCMKKDTILHRIKAFILRLLQLALFQSSAVAASILALISEIIHEKPQLLYFQRSQKSKQKEDKLDIDPDEEADEEHYDDVDSNYDNREHKSSQSLETGWVHKKISDNIRKTENQYDPYGRNPLYAHANSQNYYELLILIHHYHPSVCLFSQKVLNKKLIVYDGDPLIDFTNKHFLERFVFRNPKKVDTKSGNKFAGSKLFKRISKRKTIPIQELPLKSRNQVPLEEQFIYDYLVTKKREEKDDDDDLASVTSEDFERILDRYEPDGRGKKGRRAKQDSDEDDSEYSDDDIDTEDEEYKEAFDDLNDEIEEAKREMNMDADIDEEEDDQDDDLSRFNRKGRDKSLAKLFAAADQFSHLLEGKESDKEDSDSDQESSKKRKKFIKKGKKINRSNKFVRRDKKRNRSK